MKIEYLGEVKNIDYDNNKAEVTLTEDNGKPREMTFYVEVLMEYGADFKGAKFKYVINKDFGSDVEPSRLIELLNPENRPPIKKCEPIDFSSTRDRFLKNVKAERESKKNN